MLVAVVEHRQLTVEEQNRMSLEFGKMACKNLAILQVHRFSSVEDWEKNMDHLPLQISE